MKLLVPVSFEWHLNLSSLCLLAVEIKELHSGYHLPLRKYLFVSSHHARHWLLLLMVSVYFVRFLSRWTKAGSWECLYLNYNDKNLLESFLLISFSMIYKTFNRKQLCFNVIFGFQNNRGWYIYLVLFNRLWSMTNQALVLQKVFLDHKTPKYKKINSIRWS